MLRKWFWITPLLEHLSFSFLWQIFTEMLLHIKSYAMQCTIIFNGEVFQITLHDVTNTIMGCIQGTMTIDTGHHKGSCEDSIFFIFKSQNFNVISWTQKFSNMGLNFILGLLLNAMYTEFPLKFHCQGLTISLTHFRGNEPYSLRNIPCTRWYSPLGTWAKWRQMYK